MNAAETSAASPRNLLVFCDGTNNEFCEHNTNVVRLLASATRDTQRQIAFYDPGVGTFPATGALTPISKRVTQLLGSAFGFGMSRNVGLCYDFLLQHYRPGDRIFLFGFSRGAYTARVLAALIHVCGLLRVYNPNLAAYALRLFRKEAGAAKRRNDREERRTQRYQHLQLPLCDAFRETFSSTPPIHFLGVWDTVSSVGSIYNPFKLPFTRWNPSVRAVRHAVSIDERRKFFRTNLWSDGTQDSDVKQIWFAGVHSDVGGGYANAESGLSKIALAWMMDEAVPFGLELDPAMRAQVLADPPPDPLAKMHNALDHLGWKLAQWMPRREWVRIPNTPQFRPRWRFSPAQLPRYIADGSVIHSSVHRRVQEDPGYRPVNLPDSALDESGVRREFIYPR
ncbi:DUF2235 domain-containing protein [Oleiagrimonas soli]|uniref:Uncharacterized protein (DUF2235 family) n=1 Tax=Oleiagrimonas soli TaxID=1543381 RepID=A0A099CYW5_9GAMM|nr:DUF2235 domain-containing protein [Oleiagrimonas soli]KGI78807.1 hypothetical protein LF63_0102350 [Oleiagrimonas soli]MBB6184415.1 uncharacterized protein (DUF2235 family) [Oleiagrimonas soli]